MVRKVDQLIGIEFERVKAISQYNHAKAMEFEQKQRQEVMELLNHFQ